MRRAARTDANHAAVVAAFRKLGCSVLSLAGLGQGVPDLLCCCGGVTFLCEVKDGAKPPSARRLTGDQAEFHAGWAGDIYLVKSLDDVARIVRMANVQEYEL